MGNHNNKKKRKKETKTEIIKDKIKKIPKKKYKIIFVGECAIGAKTTLIRRIMGIEFDDNTYYNLPCEKYVDIGNNIKLILKLWDTAGQERYKSITEKDIKYNDCVVLGYDITNKDSFEAITYYWCHTVKDILGSNALIYLVGNKIDLDDKRVVSKEVAIEYAEKEKLRFFEISCKTNEGFNEFYNDLVNQISLLYFSNT